MSNIRPYIIINGKNSNEINGLIISSLPPISKPPMRAMSEEIDGRDGDIITKLGFSAYDKTIQIGLAGTYDVNAVIEYFNQEGVIIFSNEADKYYRFTQLNGIDFEKLIRFKTASVTFHCQPFKYSNSESPLNFFEPQTVEVTNSGNIYSKPELAITGKGFVDMKINNQDVLSLDFGESQQTLIIDSEKMNCYGARSNINKLDVAINPKQDLNGFESAWIDSDDKAPYLFRKTAGTVSRIGNKIYDQVFGGSFNWNQLVQNGNFESTTGWITRDGASITSNDNIGNVSFSSTSLSAVKRPITMIQNHVYFIQASAKGNDGKNIYFALTNNGGSPINPQKTFTPTSSWGMVTVLGKMTQTPSNDSDLNCVMFRNASGEANSINIKEVEAIDLTAFFGSSTIADYVYNLETATAGAGIAWLKNNGFFTKPYFEYNAGSLESVKTSAHIIKGFNQWDEEWKIKLSSGVEYLASKNPIPVFPNTTYYIKTPTSTSIDVIDRNDNYISFIGNRTNATFVTPANCHFIRITTPTNLYGNVYNHDICINISDDSLNGTYKPFASQINPLDSVELRGIPQIDANGNLSYLGDVYSSNGNERKFKIVDLGSLNWSYYGGVMFTTEITDIKQFKAYSIANMITPDYEAIDNSTGIAQMPDMTCKGQIDDTRLYIKDSRYSDGAIFKTAMDGHYLIYEAESSTIESASSFTNPQMIDANGSEEYVDGHYWGCVNLGDLTWDYLTNRTNPFFRALLPNVKTYSSNDGNTNVCLTNNFVRLAGFTLLEDSSVDNAYNVGTWESNPECINIVDKSFTDANSFKTAMAGTFLFYEISTSSDVSIPVGHNTLHANLCNIEGWDECSVYRNGVNQWDEVTEAGSIDATTGANATDSSKLRSKNYIAVKSGKSYYFHTNNYDVNIYGYDSNKAFVSVIGTATKDESITIPNGIDYLRFVIESGYGTTYNHDISINYPSTITGYVEFEGISNTIDLGTDTVYGGVLDVATGVLKITKAKKAVLSSMNFRKVSGWNEFTFLVADFFSDGISVAGYVTIADLICNLSSVDTPAKIADARAHGIGQGNNTHLYINFGCDLNGIKSICDAGFYVLYNLANPIEIQLTAWEIISLIGENNIFANTGEIENCVYTKDGSEHEASGDIITFTINAHDIISDILRNRLVTGNYDNVRFKIGKNTITFIGLPDEAQNVGEVDELSISNYSRWL